MNLMKFPTACTAPIAGPPCLLEEPSTSAHPPLPSRVQVHGRHGPVGTRFPSYTEKSSGREHRTLDRSTGRGKSRSRSTPGSDQGVLKHMPCRSHTFLFPHSSPALTFETQMPWSGRSMGTSGVEKKRASSHTPFAASLILAH